MALPIPSELAYGRVTGQFIKGIKDGSDPDDIPDIIPATGSITFTPKIVGGQTFDDNPGLTLIIDAITVTLDEEGAFDEKFIATNIGTTKGWTWEVSFNIAGLSIPTINISMPAGSDRSIHEWLPAAVSNGVITARGPAGPAGTGGGGMDLTGNEPGIEVQNTPGTDPTVAFDGGVMWAGEFFGEHVQLVRASLRDDGSLSFQVNGAIFYGEPGWVDIAAFGGAGTSVLEGIGEGLGLVATRAWVTATGGGTVPDDVEVESLVIKVPGRGFDHFTHRVTVNSGADGLLIERWDEESSGWVDWLDARREAGTEAVDLYSTFKTTGTMRNLGPVFKINQDGDDVLQPFFYASVSPPSWTEGPNGEVVLWADLSAI